MTFKQWLLDTLERAGSTLVQSAIVFFLAAQGTDGVGNWKAIFAALFPAVANVILNALTYKVPLIKNFWGDLCYRVARTFLVVFLGAMVATTADLFDVDVWQAAAVAGGAAVLAVIKAEISKRLRPSTITPASLVTNDQFAKAG